MSTDTSVAARLAVSWLEVILIAFTRELYRAFLDGYPLEASSVEARTALSGNDWD